MSELLEDRVLLAAGYAANYAPNELLVQYKADATDTVRNDARNVVGASLAEQIHTRAMVASDQGVLERITLPDRLTPEAAMKMFENNPHVQYAEPNWLYTPSYVSNDPYYTTSSQLWGMYSDDQPAAVGPAGTTNQFGSQAEEAWDAGFVGSGSVYVGIIDEGFQYTHPDLADNAWTNPFDPADGIDNDGNGFVDDIHGWDFYSNDNSVYDGTRDDHGTHVAGTIGGKGGNGIGVAGVNWNVTMISTKFLGPRGGYTSGAVAALDYLTDMKTRHQIDIVASNNSWGGGGFSQALLDAITRAANEGILFVAAAGNSNVNNDTTSSYPSNYNTTAGAGYDAVIAVAAIDSSGNKASFSSYGAATVDIAAPGVSIYSTLPSNTYGSYSGTSMATPHVTGAVALYAARKPGTAASTIRDVILNSATPTSSMNGITVTGGRLNVSALMEALTSPALSINDVSVTEGDSGTVTATFTISLSAASESVVTVNYSTANGTASAGSDYFAVSNGSVTIAPHDLNATISITINGDTSPEQDETFFVNLSSASNAVIADGQGVGTILNDDVAAAPSLSVNDVAVTEGNKGSKRVQFTISLSAPITQSVTVRYATADGTATAGEDYTATSGTATISAGNTSTTITVTVKGDRTPEADETFYVNLSDAVNAVISDGQAVGTIINDDGGTLGGRTAAAQAELVRLTLISEISSLIDDVAGLALSPAQKSPLTAHLAAAKTSLDRQNSKTAAAQLGNAVSLPISWQKNGQIDSSLSELLIQDISVIQSTLTDD